MRTEFLRFLTEQQLVPVDRTGSFAKALQCAPEPIGAIAFRYGLITGSQIDDILDEQRREYRPFGEIAVDKEMLTTAQVETLLYIQHFRSAVETAEALALAGVCPAERLVVHLGRFLSKPQAVVSDRR